MKKNKMGIRDLSNSVSLDSQGKENIIGYVDLFNRIKDGILSLDKDGLIIFINQSGAEMMKNKKPQDLIGKNIWQEYPQVISSPFYKAFQEAFQTRKTIVMEDYSEIWGRYYENRIYPSPDGLTVYFSDITERKVIEHELRESLNKLEEIQEIAKMGNWTIDLNNGSMQWSHEMYINFGLIEGEYNLTLDAFSEFTHPDDKALMDTWIENIIIGIKVKALEFRIIRPDGDLRWIWANGKLTPDEDGNPAKIIGTAMDITDQKQIEKEKYEIEERFRQALENIPDVIVIYDQEKRIQFINQATRQITGRPTSDFFGKFEEDIWPPEIYSSYLPTLNKTYRTKKTQSVETEVHFSEDEKRNLKITCVPILNDDGKIREVMGITHDYSEREKSKELLRESENRYRLLIESSPYAIGVHQDGKIVFVNPAAIRMLGAKNADDLVGKPITSIIHPEGVNAAGDRIKRMLEGELGLYPTEDRYVKLDGSVLPVEVTAAPFIYRGKPAIQVIALDLTEKKKAEEDLANEAIRRRILIENSRDGIVILNKEGQVYEANLKAEQMLGYSHDEFLELSVFDWDSKFSKKKLTEMINTVDQKGDFFETKHRRKDGSEFDVEISSNASMYMGEKLIFSVIRDITERKKAQNELQNTLTQLRHAVATTVRVLIQAIEIRDPYTAGHQRRVADLARSIAEEIHLTSEQIEGIRIAATIHDIGKISIPTEILSKPTRLSDTEMQLVREHAKNGYEILKDVESQWPLADIVHQHHEKINGSGYPLGLKGEEILIEARILCVADVVEAMASHRPYRPALGIDVALEEIEKNKGILYDERIVDACLKIFKDKKFEFK